MQRMLWGCCYASIYQAQPDSTLFGQVPLHAGQQVANLTSGLGASRLVLSDFEAALVIQHHSGSVNYGRGQGTAMAPSITVQPATRDLGCSVRIAFWTGLIWLTRQV